MFARDAVWRTEPLALIELSNVLVRYERARYITAATARDCLRRAAAFLQPHFFRVSHDAALDTALRYRVTAYDARFLAAAQQLGRWLVTEDTRLRARGAGAHPIAGRSARHWLGIFAFVGDMNSRNFFAELKRQ